MCQCVSALVGVWIHYNVNRNGIEWNRIESTVLVDCGGIHFSMLFASFKIISKALLLLPGWKYLFGWNGRTQTERETQWCMKEFDHLIFWSANENGK